MDPLTLTLLVVGGVSLAVLLISVVAGDIAGAIDVDADGPFSLPAIAAFLGGGGFAGAIAATLIPTDLGVLRLLLSLLVAVAVAVPLAWGALKLTSTLMNMRTDATLDENGLLGAQGIVVTAIGAERSYGEVRLTVGGHTLKYHARSAVPLPVGTPVYVIAVPSETSVEVVSTAYDSSVTGELSTEHPTPHSTEHSDLEKGPTP